MAPPRKPSVRKGKQAATRTPPATPRSARQPRRRSASPPNQPTPVAIRDEPPARSTRSWVSAAPISNVILPTPEQRNPVDCPFLRCRAVTEHQHLPQLQYYRPRPDRAVQNRGFGNSGPRVRPARRTARQDHDTSPEEPVVAGNEEVAGQEQKIEDRGAEASDNGHDTQDSFTGEMGRGADHSESFSGEMSEVEERSAVLDDEVTDDTVHKESESSVPQAPMTPPPSSPVAAEEESSAHASPISSNEHEQSPSPASPPPPPQPSNDPTFPEPQNNTPVSPTQHIHTLDELIRPLVDPTLPPAPGMAEITRILQTYRSPRDPSYRPDVDPDLPSLMLREDDDVDPDELLMSSLMAINRERDTGYREGVPYFDIGQWEDEERMDWEAEAENEGW